MKKVLVLLSFLCIIFLAPCSVSAQSQQSNNGTSTTAKTGGGVIDIIQRTGKITIIAETDDPDNLVEISIVQLDGNHSYSKKIKAPITLNIPTSNWPKGTYLATVTLSGLKETLEFKI